MAVRQVVTFKARLGEGRDFAEGLRAIVEKVRQEPGCEQYELFLSDSDPDKLVVLERWSDEASLDSALHRLYAGLDDPALAFMLHLESAPTREQYEV